LLAISCAAIGKEYRLGRKGDCPFFVELAEEYPFPAEFYAEICKSCEKLLTFIVMSKAEDYKDNYKRERNFQVNLVVVGKDSSLYDSLKSLSLPSNFNIFFCGLEEDILSFIERHFIRVSFLDMKEGGKDELHLLQKLKDFDSLLEVIIAGPPIPSEEVMSWVNKGATDYLVKPIVSEKIQAVLNRIAKKGILRRKTFLLEKKQQRKYYFYGLISKNPQMFEIFSLIENIAKHFSAILVTGETGTGKEMIARAIHRLSLPEAKKYVICDCASIPENLFESELFGYTKGAFTGADKNKKGLFEEADGGIIFLDEIAEIPVAIQAKLLRVLENHEFRPLGSNENRNINVRVIAATSHDLRAGIRNTTFRDDLFHRLNKVEIQLPSLRERVDDIPLLLRYYLQKFNKTFSKQIHGVSREVQQLFFKYDWPGNVRELVNVLESASLICKKDFINLLDLPKYLQNFSSTKTKFPIIDRQNLSSLKNLEKDYIEYLVKTTNHNLRKTAKILGISRTTLYNKMSKYNLS
jgi:DNA-binding NtrC family response regulator